MTRRATLTLALATAAMTSATAGAQGQPAATPPPTGNADRAAKADQEVVVTADTGERRLIDRKSYTIQDTPAAETKTATEVLRDLPSVSADSNGRLRLLGNSNVTIQIDGRAVPDANAVLRNLTGNQIARVEVITNPSAEFAASGTAGIINVILRKAYRPGIGGSASGSADTLGGFGFGISPTWSAGPWTLSASPRVSVNRSRSAERDEFIASGGTPDNISNRIQDRRSRYRNDFYSARSQLGYKLDERRNLTATLNASARINAGLQDSDVRARAGEFLPFRRRNDAVGHFNFGGGSLEYRADGRKPNEAFSAATEVSIFSSTSRNDYQDLRPAGAGRIRSLDANRSASVESKFDYATPRGKSDRLAVGGQFEASRSSGENINRGAPLIGPPRSFATDYAGSYTAGAAYATYQTGVGKLKLLPGLRVEARRYRLDGSGGNGPSRADLFPSLHLEHPLVAKLAANLSYSRRVDWPEIEQLYPIVRFYGPTAASAGNPALRPAFTDAFEGKLAYAGKDHNGTLTLFDRITRDTFDSAFVLRPDGILLSTQINAGTLEQRGAELAVQGKIMPRLRYSASGNIAATRRTALGDDRRSDAQYEAKAQMTYAEPRAAAPGFDQVEVNLRYTGPRRAFQFESDDVISGDVTWTHRLTRRLSAVLSVRDPFGAPRYRYTTRLPNLVQRSTGAGVGPVVRLSLTYSLAEPNPAPPPAN